jgi:hypothetical protein
MGAAKDNKSLSKLTRAHRSSSESIKAHQSSPTSGRAHRGPARPIRTSRPAAKAQQDRPEAYQGQSEPGGGSQCPVEPRAHRGPSEAVNRRQIPAESHRGPPGPTRGRRILLEIFGTCEAHRGLSKPGGARQKVERHIPDLHGITSCARQIPILFITRISPGRRCVSSAAPTAADRWTGRPAGLPVHVRLLHVRGKQSAVDWSVRARRRVHDGLPGTQSRQEGGVAATQESARAPQELTRARQSPPDLTRAHRGWSEPSRAHIGTISMGALAEPPAKPHPTLNSSNRSSFQVISPRLRCVLSFLFPSPL